MSDEPINIDVEVQEVEPINIDVHLADYNNVQDEIDDINETLRTYGTDIEDIKTAIQDINRSITLIQNEMPNASIVLEADYIDGTSEQIQVATYENQST